VYTATTGTRTIIDITNSASGTLTSDIHDPVNIITSDIITEIVITDTAENILLIMSFSVGVIEGCFPRS
jgi:hypothetical protein